MGHLSMTNLEKLGALQWIEPEIQPLSALTHLTSLVLPSHLYALSPGDAELDHQVLSLANLFNTLYGRSMHVH